MEMNKHFINPYNFVRYSDAIKRESSSDYDKAEKVTGYIDCTLNVAEKLALPDHENADKTITKGICYNFFKVNDTPVIPGSEIKGCIRSLYEALTNSCFSVINANILTKRISIETGNVGEPCIVKYENSKWYLYPAMKIKNNEAGSVVRNWKASPKEQKNGKRYTKHFYQSDYSLSSRIDCADKMEGFKEILEMYLKNNAADKKFCDYIKIIQSAIEKHQSFVAFYLFDGMKLTYFSPAQISRTSYINKVTDFLGDHSSCTGNNDEYCSGCRLFGTLGNNKPIASRLRFSDAVPVGDTVRISPSPDMLPPLSSPKITSIEFYSVKGNQLRDVQKWDYDDTGVTLRGRKFYFHSLPKNENGKSQDALVTGQFKTNCALKGSRFAFKVYFDSISKEDLGKLLWVLALGDNREDSEYMQKIGAGKPVGYGSVKITVNGVALRSAENYSIAKHSYDEFASDESAFDSTALKDIKCICNYNYLSADNKNLVSYPIGDDGKGKPTSVGSLQWFKRNRTARRTFKQVLPTLSDNAEALIMDSQLPGSDVLFSGNNGYSSGRNNNYNANRNKGNFGYQKGRNNNNRDRAEIPALTKASGCSLTCEVCGKTEEVAPDVYKQRKNGGYKCKDCRKKK